MSISPPQGPSNLRAAAAQPAANSGVRAKDQRATQDQELAAAQAERDAQSRIVDASNRAGNAERELQTQLDHQRDDFSTQSTKESDRESASLETERQKGYKAILEMQRAQSAELARIRRQGEHDQEQMNEYYRNSTISSEHDGKSKLTNLQNSHARQSDYEKKTAQNEFDLSRVEHARQMSALQETQEQQVGNITQSSVKLNKALKDNSEKQSQIEQKQFEDRYQNLVAEHDQTLNTINSTAGKKIEEIRQDTSQRLDAYASRQNDPFYKMMVVNASVDEKDDSYVLTATIPEHEQQHVNVSVRGNQLVISGYRRNEEKLELEPGHRQGSASFQSYSESFPLPWPVESHLLSKEFSGNTLIARVPKKTSAQAPQHHAAAPTRIRQSRPVFPDNIPLGKQASAEDQPPADKPSPKIKGSSTLS